MVVWGSRSSDRLGEQESAATAGVISASAVAAAATGIGMVGVVAAVVTELDGVRPFVFDSLDALVAKDVNDQL